MDEFAIDVVASVSPDMGLAAQFLNAVAQFLELCLREDERLEIVTIDLGSGHCVKHLAKTRELLLLGTIAAFMALSIDADQDDLAHSGNIHLTERSLVARQNEHGSDHASHGEIVG